MGKPHKFATVGCGRVVSELHVPAWKQIGEAECVAVCDEDPDAARSVRRRLSAKESYQSVKSMLADDLDIDFVVVATPGHTHSQITKDVLLGRHHVLCEKPFVYRVDELEDIASLASENELTVTPIHNYRYKANSQKALSFFCESAEPVRHVDVTWRDNPFEERHTEWIKREREHRLMLYDFSYHFIDMAQLLLERPMGIEFVVTEADEEYTGYVSVELGNGNRSATLDLRLDSPTAFASLEVTGANNTAIIDYYPDGFRVLPTIDTPLHRGVGDLRRTLGYGGRVVGSQTGLVLPQNAVGHYRLFRQFINSIDGNEQNPVPLPSVQPTIDLLERLGEEVYDDDRQ